MLNPTRRPNFPARHPAWSFCLLSFAIAFPAFGISAAGVPAAYQLPLLLLGSYAPALSAYLVASNNHTRPDLRRRAFGWHFHPGWLAICLLLPGLVWLAAMEAVLLLFAPVPVTLANLALLPVILFTNFGEELGWRGFLLPRLLERLNPLAASLVLGGVWIAFHAPLYWQRPLDGLFFLVLLLPISVLLTWIFSGTRGSVLYCTLFHAVFNAVGYVFLTGSSDRPLLVVVTFCLALIAAILVLVQNPKWLALESAPPTTPVR